MSYALFVGLAFVVGLIIRRAEVRRLAYASQPGHAWVSVGALAGAVVGAKLGMVLFYPLGETAEIFANVFSLDFTGKTIIGGLAGGFIGVEITKKVVGISKSTGDAFAVALPVAQAIGRVGCWLHGCCYGHTLPVQLIETGLLLVLAGVLFTIRERPRPRGHLFRYYLIGYALIRLCLEPLRGDPSLQLGPLTAVSWVCLATMAGFGLQIWMDRRRWRARGDERSG